MGCNRAVSNICNVLQNGCVLYCTNADQQPRQAMRHSEELCQGTFPVDTVD